MELYGYIYLVENKIRSRDEHSFKFVGKQIAFLYRWERVIINHESQLRFTAQVLQTKKSKKRFHLLNHMHLSPYYSNTFTNNTEILILFFINDLSNLINKFTQDL